MADRDQQIHPAPQHNDHAPPDLDEAALMRSKNLKKKKRIKCLAFILILALFLTGIILVLTLFFLKVRTPKFSVSSGTIDNFNMAIIPNPSLNMTMKAELAVRNNNFGRYRFQQSTVHFLYDGVSVGDGVVGKAKAGARSTEKFSVVVSLSSRNVRNTTQLELDLGVGVLTLHAYSQLKGKLELLNVIKRDKSTELNCLISINLSDEIIRSLQCQ